MNPPATEQDLLGEIEERFARLKAMIGGRVQPSAMRTVAAYQIRKYIAEFFGITDEEIAGAERTDSIVFPRMVCAFLLRRLISMSLNEVSAVLDYGDHGSVLHAIKRVGQRCEIEPATRKQVQILESQIRIKWPEELFKPVAKGDFKI